MVTRWAFFAGGVVLLSVALVAFARASTAAVDADATPRDLTTGELLANVALTQGLFAALLVAVVGLAKVPLSAFGLSWSPAHLALGAVVGVALYAADEALAHVLDAAGVVYDEALRDALSPDSAAGWLALLFVALPLVAGFEELLFRGALVGALSVGLGVSPWILAVASSVAFGAAHTAQGGAGVFVATALGFALAAVFVLTGSLLVVVVAHYLVNALEFVVHARD